MSLLRTRVAAALTVTAFGLLPTAAHHETVGSRYFLAFWSGYQAPAADPAKPLCLDGRYWEKGFVSIYGHGLELSKLP